MANTYYEHNEGNPKTMTVRDLIAQLSALPEDAQGLPAIFKSPRYGCYGPETAYTLDRVEVVDIAEETREYGPQYDFDEDTGQEVKTADSYSEVLHAWRGVVIA